MPILAIRSSTRRVQSTGKRVICDGTDTQDTQDMTYGHRNLKTELALLADSVKNQCVLRGYKEVKETEPSNRGSRVFMLEQLGNVNMSAFCYFLDK